MSSLDFCSLKCNRSIEYSFFQTNNSGLCCCKPCHQYNGNPPHHSIWCRYNNYKCLQINNKINDRIVSWYDINSLIINKYNKIYGNIIRKYLPNIIIDPIKWIIIEYTYPISILLRNYYTPIFNDIKNCSQNINEILFKSKIYGPPYLYNNESIPVCKKCSNELSLLFQLNVNELPNDIKQYIVSCMDINIECNEYMIQLFICIRTNCDVPHNRLLKSRYLLRVIKLDRYNYNGNIFQDSNEISKIIIHWTKCVYAESPFHERRIGFEILPHGCQLNDKDLGCGVEGFLNNAKSDSLSDPLTGHKLGGYPYFPENLYQTTSYLYPRFPQCTLDNDYNNSLFMIFQYYSGTLCVQLFICKHHKRFFIHQFKSHGHYSNEINLLNNDVKCVRDHEYNWNE